jgi:hypothetical protein
VRGRTAGVSGRWTAMTATSYKLKAVYHIGIIQTARDASASMTRHQAFTLAPVQL